MTDVDQVITEDWPWIASFFFVILVLLLIGNKWCCACCNHTETSEQCKNKEGENQSTTINFELSSSKERLFPTQSSSSRRNSRIYHHV